MHSIEQLIDVAKQEFSGPGKTVEFVTETSAIRVSQKTLDDPSRPSKSVQPIIIKLHDDFDSSSFAARPLGKIQEEFAAFIRHKRSQFQPRETNDAHQSHVPDKWVFPEQC